MNTKYKYTIDFGKVDYNNTGSRRYPVELELCLAVEDTEIAFTASGNVWKPNRSDIVMGGQCIDSIWTEFSKDINDPTLYKRIMNLWKKWHLNDMRAGCRHQRAQGWGNGMLTKPCPICGYKYGTEWLYEKIDKRDLYAIMDIMQIDYTERNKIRAIYSND